MRLQLGASKERAPALLDARQHALRQQVIDALSLAAEVGSGLRHAEVRRAGAGGLIAFALKERDDAAGDPLHSVLGEAQPDAELLCAGDPSIAAVYVFIPSPVLADALGGAVR